MAVTEAWGLTRGAAEETSTRSRQRRSRRPSLGGAHARASISSGMRFVASCAARVDAVARRGDARFEREAFQAQSP
eukprot:350255-Chlamydomonas_euryale.AAC.17